MVCRNRETMRIEVEGVPLGLLPDRDYDERTFEGQPGDIMVLFSDGVSDHVGLDGEEYGRASLASLLRRCHDNSPQEIVDEIFADLDRVNTDRFDDQTLIVMRVK
jgi:serine phosphatase RsbU (regulator of sigma subunit)